MVARLLTATDSNTTLVKVKYTALFGLVSPDSNSNTTLVKVKC